MESPTNNFNANLHNEMNNRFYGASKIKETNFKLDITELLNKLLKLYLCYKEKTIIFHLFRSQLNKSI